MEVSPRILDLAKISFENEGKIIHFQRNDNWENLLPAEFARVQEMLKECLQAEEIDTTWDFRNTGKDEEYWKYYIRR